MNLAGRKIVVVDVETKRGIDFNKRDDYDLGVSVAVSFSFEAMDYGVFMDDNMNELVDQLNAAELVVGFNIDQFDLNVIAAHQASAALVPGAQVSQLRTGLPVYDLLYHSRRAMGWSPARRFPTGMKLDNHLLGTFGPSWVKTAAGAEAPGFYRDGKIGRLVSYCVGDVKREAALFKHLWANGTFTTDTHGTHPAEVYPQAILDPAFVHPKAKDVMF